MRASQGHLICEAKWNKTERRWNIGQLYSCSFLPRYFLVLFYKGGLSYSGLSLLQTCSILSISPSSLQWIKLQLNLCLTKEHKDASWKIKTAGLFKKGNSNPFFVFFNYFLPKKQKTMIAWWQLSNSLHHLNAFTYFLTLYLLNLDKLPKTPKPIIFIFYSFYYH